MVIQLGSAPTVHFLRLPEDELERGRQSPKFRVSYEGQVYLQSTGKKKYAIEPAPDFTSR
jgi:hypothetical protein